MDPPKKGYVTSVSLKLEYLKERNLKSKDTLQRPLRIRTYFSLLHSWTIIFFQGFCFFLIFLIAFLPCCLLNDLIFMSSSLIICTTVILEISFHCSPGLDPLLPGSPIILYPDFLFILLEYILKQFFTIGMN